MKKHVAVARWGLRICKYVCIHVCIHMICLLRFLHDNSNSHQRNEIDIATQSWDRMPVVKSIAERGKKNLWGERAEKKLCLLPEGLLFFFTLLLLHSVVFNDGISAGSSFLCFPEFDSHFFFFFFVSLFLPWNSRRGSSVGAAFISSSPLQPSTLLPPPGG